MCVRQLKKVLAQTEMMHDKSRVVVVISKSTFLPKESKMSISRGYCMGDRPNICIYVYIGLGAQSEDIK